MYLLLSYCDHLSKPFVVVEYRSIDMVELFLKLTWFDFAHLWIKCEHVGECRIEDHGGQTELEGQCEPLVSA